ncbi:MAG: SDR family NAD(P)-dependent oxidoreductase [Planctomycetota bacterium]
MAAAPRFGSALVTGASSGLGRAIALELSRRGARVHALARRAEALEELAREAASAGAVVARPCDVTDARALTDAVRASEADGPLDLVLAGAGVASSGLADLPVDERAARVLAVNLTAAVRTLELATPAMLERGSGTLAAITSLAGLRGLPASAPYCASKAGLVRWLESRTLDLARSGVRVVDVHSGFVRTAITDRNDFHMPFLLEPDDAARRTVDGLERGRRIVRYPRRLAWPMVCASAALPHFAWRALVGRA